LATNFSRQKTAIETAVAELKTASKLKMQKLKTKTEALDAAWMAASEELYKATQEAQPQPETPEQMQVIMYKMQTSKKSSKD
jgi:molecular chaperone DnaK